MGKDTRNESYYKLTNVGDKQRTVLELLVKQDLTNGEIAKALGWPINRVTPRVKELREKGLVVEKGKILDVETNRSVHRWGVPLEDGQLTFI